MVQNGMANSRMKDYYDLAILSRAFDFEAELLGRAFARPSSAGRQRSRSGSRLA
jgi:hypothetical protein